MIPKLLHFIWVGDETKRPDNCIASWRTLNPGWDCRIWGNAEFEALDWVNKRHMHAMYDREFAGVADMMRLEILHAQGGIFIDADSIALRPLDDSLLDCEAFACWENEIARPGLIANGYFGSAPGNVFVQQIIADIAAEPSVTHDLAWKTVGPTRLTESYRKYRYSRLRIYPSHYFIPQHFTGVTYDGPDPVYAHQLWGSTRRAYDEIHTLAVETTGAPAAAHALPARVSPPKAPASVQRVAISNDIAGVGTVEVFRSLCQGKRVLHVGHAEPDTASPLVVGLRDACATLDGVAPAIAALAQVGGSYDVVLVPDVLERLPNVADFLAALEAIDAATFLVSVSDALRGRDRHPLQDAQSFFEIVHPDQNAWYSPYTLANTIAKYSGFKIEQMWFVDSGSILALLSKPALPTA